MDTFESFRVLHNLTQRVHPSFLAFTAVFQDDSSYPNSRRAFRRLEPF
jgi:hypothetical protein